MIYDIIYMIGEAFARDVANSFACNVANRFACDVDFLVTCDVVYLLRKAILAGTAVWRSEVGLTGYISWTKDKGEFTHKH